MTPPDSIPGSPTPPSSGEDSAAIRKLQAALPQLEILERIGRGGMGEVYRARHRSLNRIVAVKVLPPELKEQDATFARRFKNEAQAMARLSHPAIVAVFDSGETPDGQLYFVMEHIDGTDLAAVLRRREKLPAGEALAIAIEVCEALSYAHENGVVHRDIKPSNILMTQKGRVKVADFGLAKMEDSLAADALTRTGTTMGTPEFLAPEALIMGVHVDGRADLYALGVVIYQMLMGEIPRGLFLMPGIQSRGSIDSRFDRIISKAMQSDRERRYQSAAEMRADLEAIRKNRPAAVAAHPDPPPLAEAAAVSSIAPTEPSRRSSSSGKVLGLVAAIAAMLGVAAFVIFSKPGDASPRSSGGSSPSGVASKPEVWVDGLEEWWRLPRGPGSGALLAKEGNGSRVQQRKGVFMRNVMPYIPFKDVAIRVKVRDTSEVTSLYFRMSGVDDETQNSIKNYHAVFWHSGETKFSLNGTQPGNKELDRYPPPPGFIPGGSHEFEVRVVGDEFTAFVDRLKVGTTRDSTLKEGKIYFTGDPGALVEKLEYSDLSKE